MSQPEVIALLNGRKPRLKLGFEELEVRAMLTALRVVNWNTLDGPNNETQIDQFTTIISAIGAQNVAGTARPIDLLALQETNPQRANNVEAILDGLYADDYESITIGGSSPDEYVGFVYNTATLELLGASSVSGSFTHQPLRGQFRPVGTFGDSDFYAYSIHLKAGNAGSDQSTRAVETAALRNNANNLGDGQQVIFMGDFNMRSSNETAFGSFLSPGNAQLQDPINRLGNWYNNQSFRDIHTQNPQNNATGGFMDDRFDLQLLSGEFFDGVGIDYVSGSYRAFGNNGTHSLNGPITTGSGASPSVLSALALASDHLPVVADYEFDVSDIVITETEGSTDVSEEGGSDSFSIVLASEPSSDVTISLLTTDGELQTGVSSVTFTDSSGPMPWDVPQSVLVEAVNDFDPEGNHDGVIGFLTTSSDPNYDGFEIDSLIVNIEDNDQDLIDGETIEFGGVGTYSFDFRVTAKVSPLEIGSFNLPLAFDIPGIAFSGLEQDFTPNAGFGLEFVTPLAAPFTADYGVAASTGAGMMLAVGETATLFSIVLTVDESASISSLTEVGRVVNSGFDAQAVQLFDKSAAPILGIEFGSGISFSPSIPARVADVRVSSSDWTTSFLQEIDPINRIGHRLPGPDQLRNLPWTNLDTVTIRFTEQVVISELDVSLHGVNTIDYSITVNPGVVPEEVVIQIESADLDTDKFLLVIADTATDVAGNALDGEWTDGVSLVSGDGESGGNFMFRFNVLEGDVNDSASVFGDDVTLVNSQQFTFAGVTSNFNVYADLNGSGAIFGDDVTLINERQFTFLPNGEPTASLPSAVLAQREDDAELRALTVDLFFSDLDQNMLDPIES